MHVVLLAKGRNWSVYALCSDQDTCKLLEFIEGLDPKRASKVLSDLREFVPNSTVGDWVRAQFSWKLRGTDHVLEFRWPTNRGGTPRVYWFYDEDSVIVCSHAVNKKGQTDPDDIKEAEATRIAYLTAKRINRLEIVSYDDFVSDNESNDE